MQRTQYIVPLLLAAAFSSLLVVPRSAAQQIGPATDYVEWQVEADSLYYVLKDPAGRKKYIIDPARWRVVQYEERADDGELLEQRSYGEFDIFNGLYLLAESYFALLLIRMGQGLSVAATIVAAVEEGRVIGDQLWEPTSDELLQMRLPDTRIQRRFKLEPEQAIPGF